MTPGPASNGGDGAVVVGATSRASYARPVRAMRVVSDVVRAWHPTWFGRSRATGGSLARMLPIDPRAAPSRPRPTGRRRALRAILPLLGVAVVAIGCADNADNMKASATPADFGGIVNEFARVGIHVNRVVSGDAGCADTTLGPTAIGFDAFGVDQPTSVRIHLYAFKDKSTFDRLRASVDACARAFVTDPQSYESVDAPPFAATSQGPWGQQFEAAVRTALTAASGTSD